MDARSPKERYDSREIVWSSWQAARVEVAQNREAKRQREDPLEDKVVEKIVEKTDVAPSG